MRAAILIVTIAGAMLATSIRIGAHKSVTSPFTFSDDVLPIVKARCGACHSPGGVGPMSLMTHAEAWQWGESIRVELMAGHMPPWGVDVTAGRFRNLQYFPAREMNVLLTWASGGTPAGQNVQDPVATFKPEWALGTPDMTIPLAPASIGADLQAHVEEFVIPAPARPLRAVDLLPGTPAIVRRATVSVRPRSGERQSAGITTEQMLALWVPGDHPVALDAGLAFPVPDLAELVVRIYYRKTWQHERQAMTDRSIVGLYFAEPGGTDVQVLRAFTPDAPSTETGSNASRTFNTTVGDNMRAIAVYADPGLSGANVTAVAVRPDGSREELIAFRPRADWTRRYWFREPITLPRGTRIEVIARFDDVLLPPAAARPEQSERTSLSLALNVVR